MIQYKFDCVYLNLLTYFPAISVHLKRQLLFLRHPVQFFYSQSALCYLTSAPISIFTEKLLLYSTFATPRIFMFTVFRILRTVYFSQVNDVKLIVHSNCYLDSTTSRLIVGITGVYRYLHLMKIHLIVFSLHKEELAAACPVSA